MSSAGWEVVGKSKKEKPSVRPMSKSQIKKFVENMPRIETRDPMEMSSTMYNDAFNPRRDEHNKENLKVNGVSKKPSASKKKKDQEKKEPRPKSIEDGASKIEGSDLQMVFNQSHESFPENPDVWLKDLASYLNLKLERVPEADPVFKGKPSDYPLCAMSKACQDVLTSAMKQCGPQTLEHLFYHCVNTMLAEAQKGITTHGYHIFIQALAFHKPDVALSKFPQYLDLLKTHHNRPVRCLSILWSLGQSGVKKLSCGLRVWLDLMMPALGYRSIAPYCVEYLENLLSRSEVSKAYRSMSLRDYFQVLDILFSPSSNIQADLKKRLQAQYPKLKTIAFGENPSMNLRNFFPSFLSRTGPGCAPQLKHELVSSLVTCLLTDKHCYATWCQMYTKHLPQSSVFLEHINANWDVLSKKVDRKMLRETLRSFSVTNDEIAAQRRNPPEGHAQCSAVCKDLLLKMSHNPFPWFAVIFSVVVVLVGIVAYDIHTSPNIKRSRTVLFLDSYGILALLNQAWKKINLFSTKVSGWLKANLPVMYTWVCETVYPSVSNAWKSTTEFFVWAVDASRPHRQLVMAKTVQAIEWVHALNPELWSRLASYLWLSWSLAKDYSLLLWKYTLHIAGLAYSWLLENVLVGEFTPAKIQTTASWSVSVARNYTTSFMSWCSQMVLTTMGSK